MIPKNGDRVRVNRDIEICLEDNLWIREGDIGEATGEIDTEQHEVRFPYGSYYLNDYEMELAD